MNQIVVKNWDEKEYLSDHFKTIEFIKSTVAWRNKIIMQYVFREDIHRNLKHLATHLLEPARQMLGEPIYISSGYRCPALNSMVSGAKNSLHLQGFAADLVGVQSRGELIHILQNMEYHELYIYPSYIHVSLKPQWNEMRYRDYTKS